MTDPVQRLADWFAEDVLSMTDDEIMAEAAEDAADAKIRALRASLNAMINAYDHMLFNVPRIQDCDARDAAERVLRETN